MNKNSNLWLLALPVICCGVLTLILSGSLSLSIGFFSQNIYLIIAGALILIIALYGLIKKKYL